MARRRRAQSTPPGWDTDDGHQVACSVLGGERRRRAPAADESHRRAARWYGVHLQPAAGAPATRVGCCSFDGETVTEDGVRALGVAVCAGCRCWPQRSPHFIK